MEATESAELDALLASYKEAVEAWITAIREEERLAVPDHSMKDWDTWDRAVLKEQEAGEAAADKTRGVSRRVAEGTAEFLKFI